MTMTARDEQAIKILRDQIQPELEWDEMTLKQKKAYLESKGVDLTKVIGPDFDDAVAFDEAGAESSGMARKHLVVETDNCGSMSLNDAEGAVEEVENRLDELENIVSDLTTDFDELYEGLPS